MTMWWGSDIRCDVIIKFLQPNICKCVCVDVDSYRFNSLSTEDWLQCYKCQSRIIMLSRYKSRSSSWFIISISMLLQYYSNRVASSLLGNEFDLSEKLVRVLRRRWPAAGRQREFPSKYSPGRPEFSLGLCPYKETAGWGWSVGWVCPLLHTPVGSLVPRTINSQQTTTLSPDDMKYINKGRSDGVS